MLDKVEEKIAELKKKQREEYYRKKDADLAKWGLSAKKKNKKAAPIVVTDEEYEALIDASSGVGMPSRNGFARLLNIAALIIVLLGIIVGFVAANSHEEMSFPIFMGVVIVSVLFALVFLGVSEAIRLLQQAVDLQRIELSKKRPQIVKEFPDEQPAAAQIFTSENPQEVPTHPYNGTAQQSEAPADEQPDAAEETQTEAE